MSNQAREVGLFIWSLLVRVKSAWQISKVVAPIRQLESRHLSLLHYSYKTAGALGAYQGGVYQALAESNLHPDWVVGISIGAINAAIIAGSPPEKRVERLHEFWIIYYWDGGLVSNTPLQWLVVSKPDQDLLAFQVDLWSADGSFPRDMAEVQTRQKEFQFSSRTRTNIDRFKNAHRLHHAFAGLFEQLPDALKKIARSEAANFSNR